MIEVIDDKNHQGPKFVMIGAEFMVITKGKTMGAHVYKKVELVGSSTESSDKAIENALAKAAETIRNMDWFEVQETRGHIVDGKVAHWQVVIKVGFRID